mmetsp:Transcript_52411/g.147071  ORF Transcript_52411/g.147071 Transcript_52411/m.147071 type:complete len:213 (-) Transcript_52411:328-966(-)
MSSLVAFRISESHWSVSTVSNLSKSLEAGVGSVPSERSFRALTIWTPLYICRTFWRIVTIPSIPSSWLLFIHASTVDKKPSSKDEGSKPSNVFRIASTCAGSSGTKNSPVFGSAAALTTSSTSFARSSNCSTVVSTTASSVATRFEASAANFSFSIASLAASIRSAIRIKNLGLEMTRKARRTALGSSYGLAFDNLVIISSMISRSLAVGVT